MKEHPILFGGSMVNEILADRKTRTRRIVKPQPYMVTGQSGPGGERDDAWLWRPKHGQDDFPHPRFCPYGESGDRFWVRETWALEDLPGDGERLIWRSDVAASWRSERSDVFYLPSDYQPERWRPSIHMPRWASRINLEITGVRVERLQDITEADILAEGVTVPLSAKLTGVSWSDMPTLHDAWREVWEHINGFGSWDANPWLWCISFARLPS